MDPLCWIETQFVKVPLENGWEKARGRHQNRSEEAQSGNLNANVVAWRNLRRFLIKCTGDARNVNVSRTKKVVDRHKTCSNH